MPMSRSYHSLDLTTMSAIAASLDLQPLSRDNGAPYTVLEVNTVTAPRRSTKTKESMSSDSESKDVDVTKMVQKLRRDVKSLKEYVDQRHQYATIQYNSSNGHDYSSTSSMDKPRSLVQLVERRGFHFVQHIIDPSSKPLYRVLWASLLVVCLAMASYNLYVVCEKFMSFPTHTTLHTIHLPRLEFPAITVCNLNTFRLTSIVGANLYGWFVSTAGASDRLHNHSLRVNNVSMSRSEFFRRYGHRQKDFIARWRNEKCTSADFVPIYSLNGRCFTFSPDRWRRSVRQPGQGESLLLELNVEQYEYILASTSAVGARIFVHERGSDPTNSDGYVTVPIGKYTSIRLQRIKHQKLPPPYGDCNTAPVSHFVPLDGVFCTEPCEDPKTSDRNIYTAKRMYSACICKPECQSVEYKLSSSQAAIPSYGAADLTSSIEQRNRLEEKFIRARDTYHRFDSIINNYDLTRLNDSQTQIEECLNLSKTFRYNVSRFKKIYKQNSRILLEAFKEMRKNAKVETRMLKLNSHVSFNLFVTRLFTDIRDCEKMLISVVTSANSSSADIIFELDAIKNILDHILGRGNHPDGPGSEVMTEIENGINAFRSDIIDGFGRKYEQLRANKDFFTNKTKHLLVMCAVLRKNCTEVYDFVGEVIELIKKKDNRVNKYLRKTLPARIKSLKEYVYDFYSKVKENTNMFLKAKNEIVKMYTNLKEITVIMEHKFKYVVSNITVLHDIAMTIDVILDKLHSNSANIERRYRTGEYNKTRMAKIFLNSHATAEWTRVKTICQRFKTIIENIIDEGDIPKDTVKTIIPRVSDFGLVNSPLSWLDFIPLKNNVDDITMKLASVVETFEGYSDELKQYSAGNRINSEFYRNNFLHVDIYFDELTELRHVQTPSYTLLDFTCDIGGTLALYLGASLLALVDVVDMVLKYVSMMLANRR